jgi:hypothetical protein
VGVDRGREGEERAVAQEIGRQVLSYLLRYKDYLCCRLPWQWNERQFLITELGVLYLSNSKEPKEFLPFGNSFRIVKGQQ